MTRIGPLVAAVARGFPVLAQCFALAALLFAALFLTTRASAEELRFGPDLQDAGWTIVTFPGIAPASFKAVGRTRLEVSTQSAAGLLYQALNSGGQHARKAHWRWRVHESAPPMDLTRRGADDRALGIYFIFGATDDARKSPIVLLNSSSITALVYVFGGNKPRREILPSPHMGSRGKFLVLRRADAEKRRWFDEDVDLTKDYLRAFGRSPAALLAIAIISDSDDTRTRNRAEVDALTLD
jgi:hypothetical protein